MRLLRTGRFSVELGDRKVRVGDLSEAPAHRSHLEAKYSEWLELLELVELLRPRLHLAAPKETPP